MVNRRILSQLLHALVTASCLARLTESSRKIFKPDLV